MARAMITLTWCDLHLSEKDEEVPGTAMPEMHGWSVDLCPECAAPFAAAQILAEKYGAKGKRTPELAGAPRPKVRPDRGASGPFACPQPGCGAVLATRGSLGAHGRQIHGMSVGELEGKPLAHQCTYPGCGKGFSTPQGLAVHERTHVRSESGAAS